MTAAYSPAHSPDEPSSPALDLLLAAAEVAARVGATLRLASFAVRPAPVLTAGIGSHAEDSVLAQWDREIEQAQQAVLPEPPRCQRTRSPRQRSAMGRTGSTRWKT